MGKKGNYSSESRAEEKKISPNFFWVSDESREEKDVWSKRSTNPFIYVGDWTTSHIYQWEKMLRRMSETQQLKVVAKCIEKTEEMAF